MIFDAEAMQELKTLLATYKESQQVIRIQTGHGGTGLLGRIRQLGDSFCHLQLLDETTNLPKGWAHLTLLTLVGCPIFCLTKDNKWQDLEKAFTLPDAQTH